MFFCSFINVRHLVVESLHIKLLWLSSVCFQSVPILCNQFHSHIFWKIGLKVYHLVAFPTHLDAVSLITILPIRRRPIYLWIFGVANMCSWKCTTLTTPTLIFSSILLFPIITLWKHILFLILHWNIVTKFSCVKGGADRVSILIPLKLFFESRKFYPWPGLTHSVQ